MINHQSGAAFVRCCSSVESRYSHSSSPNRRSETWPSQILSAKSFNIPERSRYPTHKHTLSLLFGGAAESPLKTQQSLHLLLSLRTQLHGGAIQQNYCLCVCACVSLCTCERFAAFWHNSMEKSLALKSDYSVLRAEFSAGWILREWDCKELAECRWVAGSTASDARVEAECVNGALLLGESKKPELPCPKNATHLCQIARSLRFRWPFQASILDVGSKDQ